MEALARLHPQLPVLLMSGYAAPELEVMGIAAPCGLLTKPFSAERLVEEVRRCLGAAEPLAVAWRPGPSAAQKSGRSRVRGSSSGARSPRQVAHVNGHGSPNGGSGWPGRPSRSCSISWRTTISLVVQSW